jgi:hypothetical protein
MVVLSVPLHYRKEQGEMQGKKIFERDIQNLWKNCPELRYNENT